MKKMGLKDLVGVAGHAAQQAKNAAEILNLDNVVLPRLYQQIGEFVARHPKLPPDLSERCAAIRALEAQLQGLSAVTTSPAPGGVGETARQLMGKAGQALAASSLTQQIRAAYRSLGELAWGKYGEKVLPKPFAVEFLEALARRSALQSSSSATRQTQSTGVVSPGAKAAAATSKRPRRRFPVGLVCLSFVGLVVSATTAWVGLPRFLDAVVMRRQDNARAVSAATPLSASGNETVSVNTGAIPVAGSRPSSGDRKRTAELMFQRQLPAIVGKRADSRTVVLTDGRVLTAVQNQAREIDCIVRNHEGHELSHSVVRGAFAGQSDAEPVIACGQGRAALAVSRGDSYHCVMLGSDGNVTWETQPYNDLVGVVAFGESGLLVSADSGVFYRLSDKGESSWGPAGGGPFLRSDDTGIVESLRKTQRSNLLEAGGVVGATVDFPDGPPSSRVAISVDYDGRLLAFIPRTIRPVDGQEPSQPVIRSVLQDGRLIAQDGKYRDVLLVFGADGRELIRKKLGLCVQALACRKSKDIFLALIAGKDLRLVRLNPNGEEVWTISLDGEAPGQLNGGLHALKLDTMLELPGGSLLITNARGVTLVDPAGKLRAWGEVMKGGGAAKLISGSTVIWPSRDGSCHIGDISAWPSS